MARWGWFAMCSSRSRVLLLIALVAAESKRTASPGTSGADACAPALGNCYKSKCCVPPRKGGAAHACFLKKGSKYAQCRPHIDKCTDSPDWLCPGWTKSNETTATRPAQPQAAVNVLDTTIKPVGKPPPPPPLPSTAPSASASLKKQRISLGRVRASSLKEGAASVSPPSEPSPAAASSTSESHRGLWAASAVLLVLLSLVAVFFPLIRPKLGI